MVYYVLLLINVFLGVSGQFLIKSGVNGAEFASSPFVNIFKALFTPLVFTGFVLYGISSLLWIMILKNIPLSIAYPTLSLGYIAVLIISYLYLGETLTLYNVFGSLLIIVGVALLFIK